MPTKTPRLRNWWQPLSGPSLFGSFVLLFNRLYYFSMNFTLLPTTLPLLHLFILRVAWPGTAVTKEKAILQQLYVFQMSIHSELTMYQVLVYGLFMPDVYFSSSQPFVCSLRSIYCFLCASFRSIAYSRKQNKQKKSSPPGSKKKTVILLPPLLSRAVKLFVWGPQEPGSRVDSDT